MKIRKIKLLNFRNYEKEEIDLQEEIVIFYGENAQGKTNLLEAVFLAAMGKSFRAKKDKELIQLGKKGAVLEIEYEKRDRQGKVKIELGEKKRVCLNGIPIEKMSEILGNINIVMFSPDDILMLKEGPTLRRKFLNMMISQLRPNYTYCYNRYQKTLDQRNNYLRQIKLEKKDLNLLEIWDEELAEYGVSIYQYRQEFMEKMKEKIGDIHKKITNGMEDIQIYYQSDCIQKEKFLKELRENREKDINRGFTSKGIQRDDFEIFINEKRVQTYGSQGQHRTAILSLKLAELQVVYQEIGEYPILLLDDFMSELDEKRRRNFLENIQNTQVLITCTQDIQWETKRSQKYQVSGGKVIK